MIRKFLFKSLIFLLCAGIAAFLFSLLPIRKSAKTSDYLEAIRDKHAYLDSLGDTAKIVFAGGSNLVFGIDSKMIQSAMRVPVVNLGLHADLGLDFILNEAASCAGEGDLIILSAEYYLGAGNNRMKNKIIELYPPVREIMDYNHLDILLLKKEDLVYKFRKNVMTLLFGDEEEAGFNEKVYSREAFNKYGDLAIELANVKPEELKEEIIQKDEDWSGIEKIISFKKRVAEKGASLVYLLPPFPASVYPGYESALNAYYKLIQNDLDIPCLLTLQESIEHDSLFFDTVYHLDDMGRELRTKKLIVALGNLLELPTVQNE